MNSMIALYLWLMSILGLPGYVPAEGGLNAGEQDYSGHVYNAPPPPEAELQAQAITISNGF